MLKVGVIGLGTMGSTHLDVYSKMTGVKVLAISDIIPAKLTGKQQAKGNIKGQAQGGFDHASARQYDEGMKLIADREVELVDICLPTPLHVEYALAAIKAGKHVLVEKPLGLTGKEAQKLVDAAAKAKTMVMCAMCMRFWPGWTWLKEVVEKGTYGKVLSATFRRMASHPGGPFYSNGQACGGAALDLHIHDTDFIQYCFGAPDAVYSRGYSQPTSAVDHIVTQYLYEKGPMIVAEGGWSMSPGFGFQMKYCVNFEKATAEFDIGAADPLQLVKGGKRTAVKLPAGMGYQHEIAYLVNCIRKNVKPTTVTIASAATSVKIVEAEVKSVATGKIVSIPRLK